MAVTASVTSMVVVACATLPLLSIALRVMTCVPIIKLLVCSSWPAPRGPIKLELHSSLLSGSKPSSASKAWPSSAGPRQSRVGRAGYQVIGSLGLGSEPFRHGWAAVLVDIRGALSRRAEVVGGIGPRGGSPRVDLGRGVGREAVRNPAGSTATPSGVLGGAVPGRCWRSQPHAGN